MDDLSPSDLKTILHSKRANLYYLEHCRVLVRAGGIRHRCGQALAVQEFRRQCIETLTRHEALDFMIDTLKATALETSVRMQT